MGALNEEAAVARAPTVPAAPAAPAAPAVSAGDVVDWRRLVAVFALSQTFTFVALMGAFPILLSSMASDLGVSRTSVAVASTVSTLAGALAAFPAGRLLDRRGGRMTMTVGSLLGVVGVVAWSQAPSLPVLYAAFVVIGVAQALSMYEAAFAVLVVATEPEHRDRSILTMTMVAGLTTYLASPVIGWLNVELGWRGALLVIAGSLAVAAVPCHLLAVPPRAVHLRRVRQRSGVSLREAVRRRAFWLLTTAFTLQAAAMSTFLLLLVSYLLDTGHSVLVATTVPVAVGVMQIVSRLALTVTRGVHMVRATVLAFAVQGTGLLLLPLAGLSVPLTVLCVAAVGVGNGVAVIARPAIVAEGFGVTEFASIMAALVVPTALARAGAPLGGAWLGDWRFLAVIGVLSLAAAAILAPLGRRGPPPPDPDHR